MHTFFSSYHQHMLMISNTAWFITRWTNWQYLSEWNATFFSFYPYNFTLFMSPHMLY